MKYLGHTLVLLIAALSSCSTDTDPINQDNFQLYELVGYQPSFSPNQEFVPVTDSLYTYRLFDTGSFEKRIGDDIAEGKFSTKDLDGQNALLLTFDDPNSDLIHSCYQGEEYLLSRTDGSLVGTWQACDGPVLFFIPSNPS